MTKSHPTRVLFASFIAAASLAPTALAGWQDPGGSPTASNTHYSVAAHRTSARQAKAAAIARIVAETKRLDAHYRFDRVPANER
jgi:hypothetical protein